MNTHYQPWLIIFLVGTFLTTATVSTDDDVIANIFTNASDSSTAGDALLKQKINDLLVLYPDLPALGSPYGTGNETFGLSSQFKRLAAISKLAYFCISAFVSLYVSRRRHPFPRPSTNLHRSSCRSRSHRIWLSLYRTCSTERSSFLWWYVSLFMAIFITSMDPPVYHGQEGVDLFITDPFLPTVTLADGTPEDRTLATQLTDYWISFTVSLDPNDGKGSTREWSPIY